MENQQEAFKFLMNQIKRLFNQEIKLPYNATYAQYDIVDRDQTIKLKTLINSYLLKNDHYLPKAFQTVIQNIDLRVLIHHRDYISLGTFNQYTEDLAIGYVREHFYVLLSDRKEFQ
jgi:hypothetical protein